MIRRKAACASCLKKRRKTTQFDCEFRNARRSAEMTHVMESASSRMITLGNVEALMINEMRGNATCCYPPHDIASRYYIKRFAGVLFSIIYTHIHLWTSTRKPDFLQFKKLESVPRTLHLHKSQSWVSIQWVRVQWVQYTNHHLFGQQKMLAPGNCKWSVWYFMLARHAFTSTWRNDKQIKDHSGWVTTTCGAQHLFQMFSCEHNWNIWKHVVRVFWWCKVYSLTSRKFDSACPWWTPWRTEPIDNCAKVFTSRSWSCVLSTGALIIDWFGLKKICICFSLFAFHIFSQLQVHNCNNVRIFPNIGLLSYSRNATLIWCIQLLRKIVRCEMTQDDVEARVTNLDSRPPLAAKKLLHQSQCLWTNQIQTISHKKIQKASHNHWNESDWSCVCQAISVMPQLFFQFQAVHKTWIFVKKNPTVPKTNKGLELCDHVHCHCTTLTTEIYSLSFIAVI